ncbi:hypothetical protein, partial [Erwinia tasmaniensis]|uniref:hypothetical protein n=1 Tax=Erwinia tasmaniensis TaxID=338565 RepID=UPI003A4E4C91
LPTELITPAVWSRIIGIAGNESTVFETKITVRLKFKQDVGLLCKNGRLVGGITANPGRKRGNGVEDSLADGRMLPTLFWSLSDLLRQWPNLIA